MTNDPGHLYYNLKGQPTFRDATTGSFPAKRRLRNDYRNSILMPSNFSDLGATAKEIYFNQSEALPRSFHSIFPLLKKMFPTWLKQTFLCVHCDGSALCFSTASLSLLSAPVITQLTLSPVCNRKRTLVIQSVFPFFTTKRETRGIPSCLVWEGHQKCVCLWSIHLWPSNHFPRKPSWGWGWL